MLIHLQQEKTLQLFWYWCFGFDITLCNGYIRSSREDCGFEIELWLELPLLFLNLLSSCFNYTRVLLCLTYLKFYATYLDKNDLSHGYCYFFTFIQHSRTPFTKTTTNKVWDSLQHSWTCWSGRNGLRISP